MGGNQERRFRGVRRGAGIEPAELERGGHQDGAGRGIGGQREGPGLKLGVPGSERSQGCNRGCSERSGRSEGWRGRAEAGESQVAGGVSDRERVLTGRSRKPGRQRPAPAGPAPPQPRPRLRAPLPAARQPAAFLPGQLRPPGSTGGAGCGECRAAGRLGRRWGGGEERGNVGQGADGGHPGPAVGHEVRAARAPAPASARDRGGREPWRVPGGVKAGWRASGSCGDLPRGAGEAGFLAFSRLFPPWDRLGSLSPSPSVPIARRSRAAESSGPNPKARPFLLSGSPLHGEDARGLFRKVAAHSCGCDLKVEISRIIT